MIVILPNDVAGDDRVDGRDDNGGSRDDGGRRYFPLIFLLFTSYFSLSLIFLLLFSFLFFWFQNFRRI